MNQPLTESAPAVAGPARQPLRTPGSTYRLQLNHEFTFTQAHDVVPYLAALGVSDCYTSPYFMARPGSTHGYDVTNHNLLNPELGTDADYAAMTAAFAGHGLGHVLDFVPNHMGIDPQRNPWWRDVLENGPGSQAARFFDIDWDTVKPELKSRILLPILGDQYGRVLDRGEMQVVFGDGAFSLAYGDHRLPLNPRFYPTILRHDVESLRGELTEEDPSLREFLSILTELQNLPPMTETDPERVAERQREKEVAKDRLARLVTDAPRITEHIARAIRFFNGQPGRAETFAPLHELLEQQSYRLSFWRTASHEINYRRFFDINDLAGICVEDPIVFQATHQLVARLIAEKKITGLRIDHPDGLYDPGRYFEMVQGLARGAWAAGTADATQTPLYLIGEKILSSGESLPAAWPVHGTTGYNFLNELNGLFVAREHATAMRRIYARFTGQADSFSDVVYESKTLIMETAMASELNVLAHALNRISERDRHSRDFTLNSLHDALREIVACFPVYRTYVSSIGWTESDRRVIATAIRRARQRNPVMERSIFDFIRDVLLPLRPGDAETSGAERPLYPPMDQEDYQRRLNFSMKLQQYTGPVQAKGLEDTAFYRYNLLLSINEVGGDPDRFGRTPAEFHEMNTGRVGRWPYELNATATHDTKLGEDVRARINVLSEIPEEWRKEVWRWRRVNSRCRQLGDGEPAPDRNDEYRFYQALVGSWPDTAEGSEAPVVPDAYLARLREYMTKATKEAKRHTSWINDNKAYDDAVAAFVTDTLTGRDARRFLADFIPFQRRVAALGMVNSLSQLVLKIMSPGVPDIYRGTELWDLTLVDPDNRRPVDFDRRIGMLASLEPLLSNGDAASRPDGDRVGAVQDLVTAWPDGRIKLFVTAACLRFRRAAQDLLLRGRYTPLTEEITVPAGLVSFARQDERSSLIVIAPRLVSGITTREHPLPLGPDAWRSSRIMLPPDLAGLAYRNLFTGEEVRPVRHRDAAWIFVPEALQTLPVAVLVPAE